MNTYVSSLFALYRVQSIKTKYLFLSPSYNLAGIVWRPLNQPLPRDNYLSLKSSAVKPQQQGVEQKKAIGPVTTKKKTKNREKYRIILTQIEMGPRSVRVQYSINVFIVTVYTDSFSVTDDGVVECSFSVFTFAFIVENLGNCFI